MCLASLISNKIDFKLKSIKRDGEGHFMYITRKIHPDEISVLKDTHICKRNLTKANHTLNLTN